MLACRVVVFEMEPARHTEDILMVAYQDTGASTKR
jgi:hypothetical protein